MQKTFRIGRRIVAADLIACIELRANDFRRDTKLSGVLVVTLKHPLVDPQKVSPPVYTLEASGDDARILLEAWMPNEKERDERFRKTTNNNVQSDCKIHCCACASKATD